MNKLNDVADFVFEYYKDNLEWKEEVLKDLKKNRKQYNKFIFDWFAVDVDDDFVFLNQGEVVFTINEIVFSRKNKIPVNEMLNFFDTNLNLWLADKKLIKIEDWRNGKKK